MANCQLGRLNKVLDGKRPISAKRRLQMEEVRDALLERDNALEAVKAMKGTSQLKQAVAFQATADAAEAARHLGSPIGRIDIADTFKRINRMSDKEFKDAVADQLTSASVRYLQKSQGYITSPDVQQILNAVAQVERGGAAGMLKYYDSTMMYLKSWQLSSPGFHARNLMGGIFNNYLAGVEVGSTRAFMKAFKQFKAGTLGVEESSMMKTLLEHTSTGQYSHAELGVGKVGSTWNPMSPNFKYLAANAKAGGGVEFRLRGALYWDTLNKGGSAQEALDQVTRFHFDYADLSHFESKVIKRIIPFYVWTRYNFPLQMRMVAENPGKYRYYQQFAQTTEGKEDPFKAVPNYLKNGMFGLPLPMHTGKEGSQVFASLDLPFTRTLAGAMPSVDNIDPKKPLSYLTALDPIASQVTPLLKAPAEIALNRQFFSGVPLDDTKATQGSKIANALGSITDKTGKNRFDYAMEQAFPLLAQVRRVGGPWLGEDKFKDRAKTSWAAFLGVPLRTNTLMEQRNEMMRIGKIREEALQKREASIRRGQKKRQAREGR